MIFVVLSWFFDGLAGGLEDGSFFRVRSSSLEASAFFYSLVGLKRETSGFLDVIIGGEPSSLSDFEDKQYGLLHR